MTTENKVIYRLDDNISFRKCTLYDGGELFHGDCTNFSEREENWHTYYFCNQLLLQLQRRRSFVKDIKYAEDRVGREDC